MDSCDIVSDWRGTVRTFRCRSSESGRGRFQDHWRSDGVLAKAYAQGHAPEIGGICLVACRSRSTFTLGAYCREKNLPYADLGLPVPLAQFSSYGLEFQRRLVPELFLTRSVSWSSRQMDFVSR